MAFVSFLILHNLIKGLVLKSWEFMPCCDFSKSRNTPKCFFPVYGRTEIQISLLQIHCNVPQILSVFGLVSVLLIFKLLFYSGPRTPKKGHWPCKRTQSWYWFLRKIRKNQFISSYCCPPSCTVKHLCMGEKGIRSSYSAMENGRGPRINARAFGSQFSKMCYPKQASIPT